MGTEALAFIRFVAALLCFYTQ